MKVLLETVQYMHSEGICHRDLKPRNILINKEMDKIKLIDFGSARKFLVKSSQKYSKSPTNRAISARILLTNNSFVSFEMLSPSGTHFYRPPEMAGGAFNYKVDMWNLGLIMIELIQGKKTKNINEIMYSGLALDLLHRLLETDPIFRISSDFALAHRWFRKNFKRTQTQKNMSCPILMLEEERKDSVDQQINRLQSNFII